MKCMQTEMSMLYTTIIISEAESRLNTEWISETRGMRTTTSGIFVAKQHTEIIPNASIKAFYYNFKLTRSK